MATPVWISLGSNIGDREATLNASLSLLGQSAGVVVRTVSSFRESSPVGGPANQRAFLNAAVQLETTLSPKELLKVTRSVEDRLGRVRSVRWGERTLDIDLLIFGTEFVETPDLQIPHPRLAVRRFVLDPMIEIAPGCVDVVTGRTMIDHKANLDRVPRWVGIEGASDSAFLIVFESLVIGLSHSSPHDADLGCWNVDSNPRDFKSNSLNESGPDLTVLVVLPGSTLIRKPLACRIPTLWFGSGDLHQISAEVVAICGGIAG